MDNFDDVADPFFLYYGGIPEENVQRDEHQVLFEEVTGQVTQPPMNANVDTSFGHSSNMPQTSVDYYNNASMEPHYQHMPVQEQFQQLYQASGPTSSSSPQPIQKFDMDTWYKKYVEQEPTTVQHQSYPFHAQPTQQVSQPSSIVFKRPASPALSPLENEWKPKLSVEEIKRVEDMPIFVAHSQTERNSIQPRVEGKLRDYLLQFVRLPQDFHCSRNQAKDRVSARIKRATGKDIKPILVINLMDNLRRKQLKFSEINEQFFEGLDGFFNAAAASSLHDTNQFSS